MTVLHFDRFAVRLDGREVLALDGEAAAGSVLVLTGEDGAEVSAALAAVLDAITSSAGQDRLLDLPASVEVDGTVRVTDASEPLAAAMTRDHGLLGALTAVENVALGLLAHTTAAPADAVTAALDAVGVPEAVRHNLAEQLSGGQQQRVALARALVVDAAVTVLDDPVSELDPASVRVVDRAIADAASRGGIVIVGRPDDQPAEALGRSDDRPAEALGRSDDRPAEALGRADDRPAGPRGQRVAPTVLGVQVGGTRGRRGRHRSGYPDGPGDTSATRVPSHR